MADDEKDLHALNIRNSGTKYRTSMPLQLPNSALA